MMLIMCFRVTSHEKSWIKRSPTTRLFMTHSSVVGGELHYIQNIAYSWIVCIQFRECRRPQTFLYQIYGATPKDQNQPPKLDFLVRPLHLYLRRCVRICMSWRMIVWSRGFDEFFLLNGVNLFNYSIVQFNNKEK